VHRHAGVPRIDVALERERRARAACAAKDRYENESEARATALMHVPGRGDRSVPYRCDVCGGWHLTSRRG
jgi:rubrerythrin